MSRNRKSPRSPSTRPFRSVASQMTADDHLAVEESAAAELRGDWAAAYRHHRSVPMFSESHHGAELQLMAELGDEAPDWVRLRFLTRLARRWEMFGQPRRGGRVLQRVMPAMYPHGIPFEVIGCDHVEQVTSSIFGRDWVVRSADVYDLGGLEDLLNFRPATVVDGLREQAEAWCRTPMGGYRVVSADGDVLVVADAATGEEIELLDLGLTHQDEVGTHVLGRVVPTSAEPGWLFDWRPVVVDEATAVAVARHPARWLRIVEDRIRSKALSAGFSHHTDTSLTADLPRHAWRVLVGMPVDGDFPRHPQSYGAEVLRAALTLATDPGAVRRQRTPLTELMLDEMVDQRLVSRFATPAYRPAWQALADGLPGWAAQPCRDALWQVDAAGEGLAG